MNYNSNRLADIYKENKTVAKRIKSKFNSNVDPILQRLDIYTTIGSSKKTYAQNYFQRLNQKEKSGRKSNSIVNIFQESESTAKLFLSKKVFHEEHARAKSKKLSTVKSIKTFPNKLYNHTVPNLFKNRKIENNYLPTNKIKPVLGRPSYEIKKLNDKKNLLPFEIEEMYDRKFSRTKSHLKLGKTAERVFPEMVIDDKNKNQAFKTLTPAKSLLRLIPAARDSLGELIEYKYGPAFRKDTLSDKPNEQLVSRLRSMSLYSKNIVQ